MSSTSAAAQFSSTCSTEPVPGIGNITGRILAVNSVDKIQQEVGRFRDSIERQRKQLIKDGVEGEQLESRMAVEEAHRRIANPLDDVTEDAGRREILRRPAKTDAVGIEDVRKIVAKRALDVREEAMADEAVDAPRR